MKKLDIIQHPIALNEQGKVELVEKIKKEILGVTRIVEEDKKKRKK